MKRIIEGRGTGKTHRLLQYAKEVEAVFVCYDPRAMREKAYSYGITGVNFISYYDFFKEGQKPEKYVIDELESFIRYAMGTFISPGELVGYSLSIEV